MTTLLTLLGGGLAAPHLSHAAVTSESSVFGQLPDGRTARLYTLRNAHGMVVKVTDLGATIAQVNVADRHGSFTNVLGGSDHFAVYQKGHPAAAATIGRFANRIKNARFPLDGREVKVTANAGANHIHGGAKGFASVLWTSRALPAKPDQASVEMTYHSADGEEGFPGNCTVTVTFTLTANDELVIEYGATTDKPTVINLTNHAYFNLAGGGTVLEQELQIFADRYTVSDADLIPTGALAPVAGTPLDFTQPHRIGERIQKLDPAGPRGYDHNFVLLGKAGELRRAARAYDPKSGRLIECFTTEPAMQLYTANHFNGQTTADGRTYLHYGAFCMETQHYPDSPNHPDFPTTTLRPGNPFHSTTKFHFSAK